MNNTIFSRQETPENMSHLVLYDWNILQKLLVGANHFSEFKLCQQSFINPLPLTLQNKVGKEIKVNKTGW